MIRQGFMISGFHVELAARCTNPVTSSSRIFHLPLPELDIRSRNHIAAAMILARLHDCQHTVNDRAACLLFRLPDNADERLSVSAAFAFLSCLQRL